MKLNRKYILFLFLASFSFSCADLEELEPINSIPSESAINNRASASAAVNGIYDAIQDSDDGTLTFDGWLALPQFFSDEANATGTFPTRLEFGNLNVFPANTTMAQVFTNFYKIINIANNVIELVPLVVDESLSDADRADFVAQAKFARAQTYLQLVSYWGDVPLILTPTKEVGEVLNVNTSPAAAIYAQVIKDFTEAKADLLTATGPQRASVQAANAFLARVNLHLENWSEAKSFAEDVLGAGFDLTTVPFLDDQVYSLGFTPTDGNVLNFFYGPSDFGGRYSIGPSTEIIAAFEPGDLRFPMTIDTSTASVPYGLKYPDFGAGISGTATDPIYFIRHAEMVLILAEAEAEMGNFGPASDWLNQVRSRAGLSDIALDAGNYVDVILKERFTEFAFEGGQRLIDLRRKGKALEVLGPIGYDACDDVWPLPQRDVDRNINLDQNDCCNC